MVHNIFIDHINDTKQHHHHGPNPNDILWHITDDCDDEPYVGSYRDYDDFELIPYGPRDHTHLAEPADAGGSIVITVELLALEEAHP